MAPMSRLKLWFSLLLMLLPMLRAWQLGKLKISLLSKPEWQTSQAKILLLSSRDKQPFLQD